MIQLNAARNRKQSPPLNSVQLGVQMRFTIGQMPVKCSSRPAAMPIDAGDQQRFIGIRGASVAQPAAGDQSQDHGAERRNEAQRQISAAVGDEWLDARKQIQEPLVERVPEIGVLVPVRGEAGVVMLPVRRHAHGLLVEARTRRPDRAPTPASSRSGSPSARSTASAADGTRAGTESDSRSPICESVSSNVKLVCVLCMERRKTPSATSSSDRQSACPNILPNVPPFARRLAIE